MKQPFPSISAVAAELRDLNANVEGECDVRLQVREGEPLSWRLNWGPSDYDQDHRGAWGASSIPGVNKGRVGRFNSFETAKDLIDQAKEMAAQ